MQSNDNSLVTELEIEQVLEDILASRYFRRAGRSGAFLRFVVTQKLSNQQEQLNSYAIGLVVFDRDQGYNPVTDNIVRVNAGRLRHKLSEYYRSPKGKKQRLQICLPDRSYEPVFLLDSHVVEIDSVTDPIFKAVEKQETAKVALLSFFTLKRYPLMVVFSATVMLFMLAVVLFIYSKSEHLPNAQRNLQTLNSPAFKDKLLGDSHFVRENFASALTHYQQAVLKSPENSYYLRQLGRSLLKLDDFDQAKVHLFKALHIDQNESQQSADIAKDLLHLGRYYYAINQYEQAHVHLHQAFEMAVEMGVDEHLLNKYYVALSFNYFRRGKYEDAQTQLDEAFNLVQSRVEAPDGSIARLYATQGIIKHHRGDYLNAAIDLKTALELGVARFGENHETVAKRRNNLGMIYAKVGQYGQAMAQFQAALKVFKRLYGEYHSTVAASYNNISSILLDQKKYADSRIWVEKSMAVNTVVFSPNSRAIAINQFNLGNIFYHQLELKKALEAYQKALTIFTEVHGSEHLRVGNTLEGIGEVLSKQGEFLKAKEYYANALPIFQQVYGSDHKLCLELEKRLAGVIVSNTLNKGW
jgi:tetratricopeptide (TPR) repeat protein